MEEKVLKVFGVYFELMGYKPTDSKNLFGMAYNTFKNNMGCAHHPKLKVLLDVFQGLFPEEGDAMFPDLPKKVANSLSANEMEARLFAAFLDDDAARMREVAAVMCRLADKEIPSISELAAYAEKKESDKKKY
ncbi:hypothetical protein [Phocaeicola sp.]